MKHSILRLPLNQRKRKLILFEADKAATKTTVYLLKQVDTLKNISGIVKWINSRSKTSFSILLENLICKETWVFFSLERLLHMCQFTTLWPEIFLSIDGFPIIFCLSGFFEEKVIITWLTLQFALLPSLMDWCYLYKHLAAIFLLPMTEDWRGWGFGVSQ